MDITKFYANPDERPLDVIKPDGGFTGIFRTMAFVGDSLKGDVLGAIRAGMKAVWFRPGPEPATPVPGAIRICSLTELPELLATL